MRIVKAPHNINPRQRERILFLSGVIDMGNAEDWQTRVEQMMGTAKDLVVLNPRRDDWDSSWEQKIENDQFREQVMWELDGIEEADAVLIYFDEKSPAPITLLELGIVAKLSCYSIVVCHEKFYRKGNVDVVCKKYGIEQCNTLKEATKKLKQYFI